MNQLISLVDAGAGFVFAKAESAMSGPLTFSVLCPSGHKVTVKASPNDPVMKLIDEACKKRKLDNPDKFVIKSKGKAIDPSLSIRFANLPNRANLELEEKLDSDAGSKDTTVSLCLQSESGER